MAGHENDYKNYIMARSPFWAILILLGLSSLIYLVLWSFNEGNVKGAILSLILMGLIFTGILLSRNKVYDQGSWGQNTLSYTLGFAFWGVFISIVNSGANRASALGSTVALPQQHLLSSITGELPEIVQVISNAFLVPIAEDLFWMIGLPFVLASILNALGEKYKFFKNLWVQMIIILAISVTSFAYFHVGVAASIQFLIFAFFFRTLTLAPVLGERYYNIFKGFTLTASFGVGAHMANNLIQMGVRNSFLQLQTQPITMIIVILFFLTVFFSGINYLISLLAKARDNVTS